MCLFSARSAACKTIRARWASPCAVLRRDTRLSSSRSSLGVKSIATAVLPIAKILRANARRESHIFVDQDTRDGEWFAHRSRSTSCLYLITGDKR
jgi:hypothetical protein